MMSITQEEKTMFGNNKVHANFSVNDLGAARTFYIDTLGFRVKREDPGQIVVEAGEGTCINIYLKPDHQAWNATVLGIESKNLRADVQALKAKGVSMAAIPGTDADGIMSEPGWGEAAWFQDPAGNWVCISQFA